MTQAGTHAIRAFWNWWRVEGSASIAASIAANDYAHVPSLLSARTSSIDPDLEWELGVGTGSKYSLTVTSGGLAALRPLAERWKRAAPASCETWQYSAARERVPNPAAKVLDFGGHRFTLADSRWSLRLDERRSCVDVGVWHPAFAALSSADRGTVAFLFLDWMLGEDGVERWVGEVDFDNAPDSTGGYPHTSLLQAVEHLAATISGHTWVQLRSRTSIGTPVVATARRPLRWIDRPDFDLHTAVRVAYLDRDGEGLPGPAAVDWLRQFEDALLGALGPRAMLLATETAEGHRTLYLHSDSEDTLSTDLIRRFAEANTASVRQEIDPNWSRLKRFK